MGKRIGVITIQKCNNFGADLQAYALGAKLRNMGYDAENIDYLFYKHPRHLREAGEKPVLPISPVNRVKEFLFPFVAAIRNRKIKSALLARRHKFEDWFSTHVKLSAEYRSVKSLYENPPRYDVYVVGSDQVWNPRMYSNITPYFLGFAPKGAKCISYASSLGVNSLPGGVYYQYKQWLKRFSAIGVREKAGVDIIQTMALGVEVKHVVDPTLLLTAAEWAKVGQVPSEIGDAPYLLLYDLISSPETVALANRWAESKGWRVARVGDGAYGPGEFVWLFAHAAAVVTNSFHGSVFSILNNKPFWSVIPRGMTNSSRLESLVKSLGLENRLVKAMDVGMVDIDETVDFLAVEKALNDFRNASIAFLIRAIEQPPVKVEYKLPLGCYAAWNANEKVRAASTSGGLFRVLAEDVIARGGVVYGAAFSKDWRSVAHQAAQTIAELEPLMKSKYVWSDPSSAYKSALSDLKNGRAVLFSGTPCQCAAIKTLAKEDKQLLTTVDLVCHGTPEPRFFEAYVREMESLRHDKVVGYQFRNKGHGWNFPHIHVDFAKSMPYDRMCALDPYFAAYSNGIVLREPCFRCPYVGLERIGDFTIADCWRIASSYPEWDDEKGTSLVFLNTPNAVNAWSRLLGNGVVTCKEYDVGLAQARGHPLMQHVPRPAAYNEFRAVFDRTKSFSATSHLYFTRKVVLKAIVTYWVKKLGWFYFRHHQ